MTLLEARGLPPTAAPPGALPYARYRWGLIYRKKGAPAPAPIKYDAAGQNGYVSFAGGGEGEGDTFEGTMLLSIEMLTVTICVPGAGAVGSCQARQRPAAQRRPSLSRRTAGARTICPNRSPLCAAPPLSLAPPQVKLFLMGTGETVFYFNSGWSDSYTALPTFLVAEEAHRLGPHWAGKLAGRLQQVQVTGELGVMDAWVPMDGIPGAAVRLRIQVGVLRRRAVGCSCLALAWPFLVVTSCRPKAPDVPPRICLVRRRTGRSTGACPPAPCLSGASASRSRACQCRSRTRRRPRRCSGPTRRSQRRGRPRFCARPKLFARVSPPAVSVASLWWC